MNYPYPVRAILAVSIAALSSSGCALMELAEELGEHDRRVSELADRQRLIEARLEGSELTPDERERVERDAARLEREIGAARARSESIKERVSEAVARVRGQVERGIEIADGGLSALGPLLGVIFPAAAPVVGLITAALRGIRRRR